MEFVGLVSGLAAVGVAAGFVVRRWGMLWILSAIAALISLAGLVFGSDGEEDTVATKVLFSVVLMWLPLLAGSALGIALGRARKRKREST